MKINDVINLSKLLGEMGRVKRATDLPSGESESDSHHSFSLALISYHIAKTECAELDANKVMLFALAHDLLEIVTGDVDTFKFTPEQHAAKEAKEKEALAEFDQLFEKYPELRDAMHDYERLDTPEAATVFVLDKACTTWTWLHHHDPDGHAAKRGVSGADDIEAWAERQRQKIQKRLRVQPPQSVLDVYEQSFNALKEIHAK